MKKILALGDVSLETKDGANPFSKIEHLFKDVDFVILNLETVIAEKQRAYQFKEKSVVLFVYGEEIQWLLQYRDKFIFTLANNHIYDLGEEGYKDTANFLKKNSFMFVPPDASLILKTTNPCLKLDAIYHGIKNSHYRKTVDMKSSLTNKTINILSIHWGAENILLPSLKQMEFADLLHKKGFDIILGHHSHTPQGCLSKNNKFTAFSLGNCNMKHGIKQKRLYCIGLMCKISILEDKKIIYRKIPIEMDNNYKPVELKGENVISVLNQLDRMVDVSKSRFLKLKYRFYYHSHMSKIYITGNFFYGWMPRIKKYGIKHFIMMLRWFISKIFITSFLFLPFHSYSKATKLMKKINK
jgi:hypothetical protein